MKTTVGCQHMVWTRSKLFDLIFNRLLFSGYPGMEINGHRIRFNWLICLLKFGRNAIEGMECSHRCNHRNCFNPDHLMIETRRQNNARMGCNFSYTMLCPHDPKCLHVDLFGKPLECRESSTDYCHQPAECPNECMLK
jgi:hypothetical protein